MLQREVSMPGGIGNMDNGHEERLGEEEWQGL